MRAVSRKVHDESDEAGEYRARALCKLNNTKQEQGTRNCFELEKYFPRLVNEANQGSEKILGTSCGEYLRYHF